MSLFVVATPIGNLDEASPRMKQVLVEADLVLCEDTRRTRTLYAALDLVAPRLMSCHAHNESNRLQTVIERLKNGEMVALVSDAGMPAVSDPGGRVVEAAHLNDIDVHVVSGPSSVIAAIAASGFPSTPFHFLGFPPRKSGAMRKMIEEASHLDGPFVFLESGRRVGTLIAVLAELLPDREAVMCRELTKQYEEIIRGGLTGMSVEPQRGEVVLVVGPGAPVVGSEVDLGPDLKTIAGALAERWECSKRDAYNALLKLENARK